MGSRRSVSLSQGIPSADRSMSSPAARQIQLTDDQLRAGLAAELNRDVPGNVELVINQEPQDLAERLGIEFQETFDNLDYVRMAVLELPGGNRVALLRHRGNPVAGTEVATAKSGVDQEFIETVLSSLGLDETNISWRRQPI